MSKFDSSYDDEPEDSEEVEFSESPVAAPEMIFDDDYMIDDLFLDHIVNPFPGTNLFGTFAESIAMGDQVAQNALMDHLKENEGLLNQMNKLGQIELGTKLWFRTYTIFNVGEVVDWGSWWIKLRNAFWVAHTGNFGSFANKGECQDKREIADHCYLSKRALVDWGKWNGKLTDNKYTGKQDGLPFREGEPIWMRTASVYNYGYVMEFGDTWLTLRDGGWIANTGQFDKFTKQGEMQEYHPVNDPITICLRSTVDWGPFVMPKEGKKK